MDDYSDLGWLTDCYCVDKIHIGENARISQHSFLCTGNHDISDRYLKLQTSPIYIRKDVWIAADVFIGSGVTIGEGAVVGARSSVFRDVKSWTVVGGNPAQFIKKRVLSKMPIKSLRAKQTKI